MADDGARGIAVIDDDPAVLDSLRFLLELVGHDVAIYSSAAEFLGDRAVRPRCVILDQHMPQMSGLELAAQLRKAGNDMPVLLITSAPSPAIIARAAELGIEKVLAKPPFEEELLGFANAHC